MPGNFVRSALLSGSAELIRELGCKPLPIARSVGVPPAALKDPDILLTGRVAYAFFERAAAVCRCPGFGLRLGSRARLAAVIGPLWVLLRNAATLGQMFEDLAANFDIYTSVATVTVERTPQGMFTCWSSTTGQTDSEVQMAEFALAVICQEVRLHCGAAWQPGSVEFRHGAPRNLAEHRRICGRNLGFNRDRNALFIDRSSLAQPVNQAGARNRALVGAVLRRDEEVIDPNIAERVESIVRALLPFAPCTVEDVGKAMGMPVRSLQHRLEAGGRTFKDIKDAVRADLAWKYLRHSSLGLAEIAEILGYSELSAFSRSFRRWHECPARSVRQDVRRKEPAVRETRGRAISR
ncbi:MAG: AraC family transcriptional regulator ligand-binding domain-containing protein [Panacagrimonas sp.]